MIEENLHKQMAFIVEVDKLKSISRQTLLIDRSRSEDDAGHSWHLALMALLLSDYSPDKVDILKVIKMVLIHDIVEIDAGDTFAYDEKGHLDKGLREERAAERIFGLLPYEQRREMITLWQEFEERATPEAKFAAALDRLQPMLLNYHTEGAAWRRHGVNAPRVVERNRHIAAGAPELWEYAQNIISEAVDKGYLTQE